MGNIIQTIEIYNRTGCMLIELPPIADEKFSFSISKDDFGISESLEVNLTVLDGAWCFLEKKEYTIMREKEVFFQRKIQEEDIILLETGNAEKFIFIIGHQELNMMVCEKYIVKKNEPVTVGCSENCTIEIPNNGLNSKQHFSIKYENDNWVLLDTSTNGTYVNKKIVKKQQDLAFGDVIYVFGLKIIFMREILAVSYGSDRAACSCRLEALDEGTLKWLANLPMYTDEHKKKEVFHRAPRNIPKYETEDIEIEGPPAPREVEKKSLFMTVGPSLTMGIPMIISLFVMNSSLVGGIVMMTSSAAIGAFWAYKNVKEQEKQLINEEKNRFEKYKTYLEEKEKELQEIYNYNVKLISKTYPMVNCEEKMDSLGIRLWTRNDKHKDFLSVRLGTGKLDMPADIRIPTARFQLIDDSLRDEPKRLKEDYGKMKDVPVNIDFMKHRLVGVVGGQNKSGVYSVIRNIIAQISMNNCYTDVKLVLFANSRVYDQKQLLASTKWLPHFWDDTQSVRFMAEDKESTNELMYLLLEEFRKRRESLQEYSRETIFKPWYIIIVLDSERLNNSQISRYLYDQENGISVATVLCVESYEQLPNECEYIVQNDVNFMGMYSVKDAEKDREEIKFDWMSYSELNKFAHRLAPIRVSTLETESEIPEMLTFMEMYEARTMEDLKVMEKWKFNRNFESMRVPIGMKTGGSISYLDIHERAHGPHGLIAGTTGSGKSEVVQSYLLSLAVNFSPEDVCFFIIDFKGGGMANLFSDLPHLIGSVSNLSGNQIHRAMVSIKSENERRQRIFAESGVNNISEYTKLYKNNEVRMPLPHLLIVIDEFAELKREQPDLMNELISVAAIGRSLGVHLILATQKPSGTVDDKIWSNMKFKLCLRVADKQDSNDMLHKPDAAFITRAGRGYLQVGENEVYEQFQSAWSGALISNTENIENEDVAQIYTINGKTVLIGNHQKMKEKFEAKMRWISELCEIWEGVMRRVKCTTKKYLANEEARRAVNTEMFSEFSKRQISIEESAFSISRLMDFALLYETVENMSADRNEMKISRLLELAESTGRKLPEAKGKTELDAIVEYLQEMATEHDLLPGNKLWLPCLEEKIVLETVTANVAGEGDTSEWTLDAVVGMYDDPEHQTQGNVFVDFANQGHYIVCGSIGSGKSTLLQTIVYSMITKYKPEEVNIYGIDFSSGMLDGFRDAPQVGAVMNEQEEDAIDKFFFMISGILADRKKILRGGSYSDYVKANKEKVFPAILLVIDQFPVFSERTNQKYDNQIYEIAKEGVNNGIFLAISGNNIGSGEIPSKLADYLHGAFCLYMNDKYQYSDILKVNRINVFPEEGIRGRGLIALHGDVLEFQVALAADAADDYKRTEAIRRVCGSIMRGGNGYVAKEVPVIPKNPVFSEFIENEDVKKMLQSERILPLGYDMKSASIWGVDLSRFFCFIISGKQRTGKRNMLHVAMQAAAAKGCEIYVVSNGGITQKRAEDLACKHYTMSEQMKEMCEELMPILTTRNKKKHRLEMEGYSEEEIYEEMLDFPNIFIFVDNMIEFIEKLYNPEHGFSSYISFFETFLNKGYLHRIFIFGTVTPDDVNNVYGRTVYNYFISERVGIHMGGNAGGQQLLDLDYLPYKEQNRVEKAGIGALASGSSMMPVGKVVIPLSNK